MTLSGAKVRYKIETNFSFYKFNGIHREESAIKEEWEKFLSETVTQMKLYTSFPSRLKIAAYVPFATPEQQLEQIMSKMREIRTINLAEDELALDWGTSEWGGSNIRILTIRTIEEKVDQLQRRALTPIPLPCGLNTYTPRKYNPQKEDELIAREDMIHHKERIEYGGMVEFSPISIMFNSEELVQEVVQKMVTKDKSNIFHGVIALHTGGLQLLYDTRDEAEVYDAAKIIEQTIKNTTGGRQVQVCFRTPIDIDKITEAAAAFHKATQKEKKETREQPASLKTGDTTATTITSASNEGSPTGGTKRSRDETSELDQHAQALQKLVTMAQELLEKMGKTEVFLHSQTTASSVTDSSRGQRREGVQLERPRMDTTSTESFLSSEVQAGIVREMVTAIELAKGQTQRVNESVRARIAQEHSAASLEREEYVERKLKTILRPLVISILEQQLEPLHRQLDNLTINPGKIWGQEIVLAVRKELAPFMQGITTAVNNLKTSVEILSRPSMPGSEMDIDPQVPESFALTSVYDILKRIELAAISLENDNRVMAQTVMRVGRKVMRSIDQERQEIQELNQEALRETLKRNLMINILHETMDSPADMDEWKKQVTKILGNILRLEESVLQTIVDDAGYGTVDSARNEDGESTTNIGTIEISDANEQEDAKQPAQDLAQAQRSEGREETAMNSNAKVSILGIGGVKPRGPKTQMVTAQDTPQLMQYDQEELAHVAMVATATVDERVERDTGSGEIKDDMEVSEVAVQGSIEEETSVDPQQNEETSQDMDTSQNDDDVAEDPSREDSIDTEDEEVIATDQSRTRFGLSSSSEESDK